MKHQYKSKNPELTEDQKDLIVEYWLSHKNNLITDIAVQFNASVYHVNKIIDNYLQTKKGREIK